MGTQQVSLLKYQLNISSNLLHMNMKEFIAYVAYVEQLSKYDNSVGTKIVKGTPFMQAMYRQWCATLTVLVDIVRSAFRRSSLSAPMISRKWDWSHVGGSCDQRGIGLIRGIRGVDADRLGSGRKWHLWWHHFQPHYLEVATRLLCSSNTRNVWKYWT